MTKRLVVVWSHEGQGIEWEWPQIKPGDENIPECGGSTQAYAFVKTHSAAYLKHTFHSRLTQQSPF